MELSQSELESCLLTESLPEHVLVKKIREISSRFTADRSKLDRYVESEESVSSYTWFYLPTNLPKLEYLTRYLPADFPQRGEGLSVAEVGCGPGTFLLGWSKLFPETESYLGIESSELMRKQARKVLTHFISDRLVAINESAQGKSADVVIFGNSLNEMGPKQAFQYIKKLNPKYVLFLEPGTKQSFSEIREIRSKLIEAEYGPVYPCKSSYKCPMTEDDWCHQVMYHVHSKPVERISQIVKLDRKVMPFIGHIYAREQVNQKLDFEKGTVVQTLPENKFAYYWRVCTEESGANQIIQCELFKKNFKKKEQKNLSRMFPGKSIRFKIVKPLPGGMVRIELLEE